MLVSQQREGIQVFEVWDSEQYTETEAEREERLAALAGKPLVRETEAEDYDETDVPCGCGNRRTCGECMRQGF